MARPKNDFDWVRNSFMVPTHKADMLTVNPSFYSSAFYKFTDSSLGGNFAINPPPQFTRDADPRVGGVSVEANYSNSGQGMVKGMGRKYSELIDDNSQLVHMQFGVPQFNSMLSFFTGSYDPYAGSLSRTGRGPGFFYNLGKVAGFVVSAPIQPLLFAGKIYRYLTKQPSSKYYFMKPTMVLYWNAVNAIANGIAINMGIVPRVMSDEGNAAKPTGRTDDKNEERDAGTYNSGDILEGEDNPQYDSADILKFHSLVPDLYRKGGGIDIYALATRTQRMANVRRERIESAAAAAGTYDELVDSMRTEAALRVSRQKSTFSGAASDTDSPIDMYTRAWNATEVAAAPEDIEDYTEDSSKLGSFLSKTFDFFNAELNDGGQFISLRVQHTGESSESFSNSVGESALAGKVNGTSASARSFRFSVADGEVGGIVGDVIGAATDLAGGLLDSVGLGGLTGLINGNAFVDIPKEWKDSTASLPTTSYSIELRSPYGNKMSRFQNLMIPLSMILAAALPKSTGKHSYDAPFLCQIYDKGRAQVRLGMIESLTIKRGAGNLGWTQNNEPLGIDVEFSVVDLSSIMHMPINPSPGLFDEDNAYSDYLAVLGGLTMADQVYAGNRLRLSMTRKLTHLSSMKSPARWGMLAANTMPGELIRAFSRETSR